MKQLVTLFIVLLASVQYTSAQNADKLELFKKNVLPAYSPYFNMAVLTEYGQLNLSATDKYVSLTTEGKIEIMSVICLAWKDSFVIVNYGYKRELWGRRISTGSIQLIDEWDLSPQQPAITRNTVPQKTALHPWFFYIGGQFGGDNKKNTNYAFNTRLGFFLLKNRWDLATTFSAGKTNSTGSSNSGWSDFGLMSRLYFPIKNLKFSPNIGAGIIAGRGNSNAYFNLGLCWFVGFGYVDIGIRIGSEVATLGGYTVIPKMGKKK